MKRLTSFLVGLAVLFAILCHSFHTMGHLIEDFGEHCDHKYHVGKTEVSHAHHAFEKCYDCEFTFSSAVTPTPFTLTTKIRVDHPEYTFPQSREIISYFNGSRFAQRGPPQFIA